MSNEDFIKFVQQSKFIGPERQALLTENSPWMSVHERELTQAEITKRGDNINKNNEAMIAEIERVQNVLTAFAKEEVPQLLKAEEQNITEESSEAAEKLLEEF